MIVLHNPRCGKSRQCIAFLEENNKKLTIVRYLDKPLNFNEIKELLQKLNFKPIDLIRQKEDVWIQNYKGKQLSDKEIIQAIVDNPILLERPIVIKGNKAFIARDEQMLKMFI